MQVNRREIFRSAWQIAKNAAAKHGGKATWFFGESLKLAWKDEKMRSKQTYSRTVNTQIPKEAIDEKKYKKDVSEAIVAQRLGMSADMPKKDQYIINPLSEEQKKFVLYIKENAKIKGEQTVFFKIRKALESKGIKTEIESALVNEKYKEPQGAVYFYDEEGIRYSLVVAADKGI